jgi:hypothetical protein
VAVIGLPATPTAVLVVVSGGLVVDVRADRPDVLARVLDLDVEGWEKGSDQVDDLKRRAYRKHPETAKLTNWEETL